MKGFSANNKRDWVLGYEGGEAPRVRLVTRLFTRMRELVRVVYSFVRCVVTR